MMDVLSLPHFEVELVRYNRTVEETPQIDRFCSYSPWILAAREAWGRGSEVWVRRGDAGYAVFLRFARDILVSFDTMWGFACPLVARDPRALVEEFARTSDWNLAAITGVVEGSELFGSLVEVFGARCSPLPGQALRRWRASLEGGLDGYLSRRSRNLRSALRSAVRKASHVAFESVRRADFDRILAVERRSWKGPEQTGLLIDDMLRFYEALAKRLEPRVLYARLDGADIGYLLGAVMGGTYRGFQLSFDSRYGHLSVGNLMQIEQIRELCEEGALVYDLGIDMDYKRRWADEAVDTITLAIR